MKCPQCQKDYPSRYYFVNDAICLECFEKMPDDRKDELVKEIESMSIESAAERTIHGKALHCPVCGHKKFWKRATLMNTPGMTFWGLDWANKQAENLICNSCGYIFWFMHE